MLDPQFVADCPYGPEALLFDEILEIDPAASRLVARMPAHAELPLTRDQRDVLSLIGSWSMWWMRTASNGNCGFKSKKHLRKPITAVANGK